MPMRHRACVLVACLLAAPVSAAELYRCVAENGSVSYQDAACDGGSVLSKTIPVRVDAAPAEAKSAKAKSSRAKARAAESPRSMGANARKQRRAACEQARKARDATLARAGLSRTFEQLRALDDGVYEACKGL